MATTIKAENGSPSGLSLNGYHSTIFNTWWDKICRCFTSPSLHPTVRLDYVFQGLKHKNEDLAYYGVFLA